MAKSRNRKLADLIVTAGVDIAGNVTFDGGSTSADLTFADGDKANFGAASDLQIYHDGSNSYIKDTGTGDIKILADDFYVQNAAGNSTLISVLDTGKVGLGFAGSEKLATTSTGINVTGITTSDTLVLEGTGVNTTYFTGGDASVSGRQLTLSSEAAGGQNNATHRLTVPSGYGSFNVTVNGKERVKINNNGDVSFYNDASSNAVKMFWDASDESLSLTKTASGVTKALKLYNNTSGANNRVAIDFHTANTLYGTIEAGYGASSPEMNFKVGNAPAQILKLTSVGIDVTGSVTTDGIINNLASEFYASHGGLVGTGSTAKVYATGAAFDGINGSLVLQSRPTAGADVYIVAGATPKVVAKFLDGGDISFYEDTGTTAKLHWSASDEQLKLAGASDALVVGDASFTDHYMQVRDNAAYGVAVGMDASANGGNGSLLIHGGSDKSIEFVTNAAGGFGTGTPDMTISTSGNVGIGTTAPGRKLHIKDGQIKFQNTSSGGWAGLDFSMGNGTYDGYMGMQDSNGSFFIDVDSNGNDLVILQNGNVGINDTNPTTTLTVGGIVQIKESSNTAFYGANYVRMFGDQNYYFKNTSGATRAFISMADGDLNLYNSSTVLTNRISTNSDSYFNGGNVGIGTTAPSYKLALKDNSASAYPLSLESGTIGTPGNHTGIRFGFEGNTYQKGAIIFEGQDANGRGKMYFAMEGSANSSNADETDAKMTIDYSGNVGIGTNAPAVKLDLRGDMRLDGSAGTDRSIYFRNQGTIGGQVKSDKNLSLWSGNGSGTATQYLTIEEGGNVGIGTTTPGKRLHIEGPASSHTTLQIETTTSGFDPTIHFVSPHNSAGMYLDGTVDNKIKFYNGYGKGVASREITFDNSGNVGIGTSDPSQKLDVKGSIEINSESTASSGDIDKIIFRKGHTTGAQYGIYDMGEIRSFTENGYAGGLDFYTGKSVGSGNYASTFAMRINSSGNVGIGQTVPVNRLHVSGADGYAYLKLTSDSTGHTASDGSRIGLNGNDLRIINAEAASILFQTQNTERMRLNASGDWMVSNTVANTASGYSAQAGCGWVDSDHHFEIATTSNRAALEIGKNNANDGSLVVFRKQSTIVGSIGVLADRIYFAGANEAVGIDDSWNAFVPLGTGGGNSDNDTDLGNPSSRFKDLYLAGIANLGYLTRMGGGTSSQTVGLVVDHGSSTSYNLIQAENDNGTWFKVAGDGVATFGGNVEVADRLLVNGATSNAQLSVKGDASLRAQNVQVATDGHIAIGFFNAAGTDVGGIGIKAGGGYISLGGNAAANQLDDYEEGTWTPQVTDGTNNATMYTSAGNGGRYTKIGRAVTFTAQVTVQTIGSVGANAYISGLPFTNGSSGSNRATAAIGYGSSLNITAGRALTAYVELNQQNILLKQWAATTGTSGVAGSEITNGGTVFMSGTYYIA